MQTESLGSQPSCVFRELFQYAWLSAIPGYKGTRLNMTPQQQKFTVGNLLWKVAPQLHNETKDKSEKSSRAELLSPGGQHAVELDGCSDIREHARDNSRPENNAQTCSQPPMRLILKAGQTYCTESSSRTSISSSTDCFPTKTSKSPRSLSGGSTSHSSLASQPSTDNTALPLQAPSKDFAPLLCPKSETSTTVLSATASPATISNSCHHSRLTTPATEVSDQKFVIDDLLSAKMSSTDTSLPCSKAPGRLSFVGWPAGKVSTSEATSGSDSFPQISPHNLAIASQMVTKNSPPSVQTAENLTATSSDHGHIPSKHCKRVANDCFVELALPLPTEIKHEWDNKISNPLTDAIYRSVDAEVTVECVMARSTSSGKVRPTVLLMCSNPRHKHKIERILRSCNFFPHQFRLKVAVLKNQRCTSEDLLLESHVAPDEKILVEMAVTEIGGKPAVFRSLAKFHRDSNAGLTAFSTIGGVIMVAGTLYGLTTGHGIYTLGTGRQGAQRSSGMNRTSRPSSRMLTSL